MKNKKKLNWSIVDNEILIDDSLNKRINIGSDNNNRWVLADEVYLS
ncbi:MAG: hypothetical protein ACJ0O0_06575 [Flavobacteriaceae bacterium]